MALNDSPRNVPDEMMPATVGTNRSGGTVQMNPICCERRGDETGRFRQEDAA